MMQTHFTANDQARSRAALTFKITLVALLTVVVSLFVCAPSALAASEGGDAAAAKSGSVTYQAQTCTSTSGREFDPTGYFMVLNNDGTGMIAFKREAYTITYTLDSKTFKGTDHRGVDLRGTVDKNGVISLEYRDAYFTFKKGASAPIMSLSPGTWFNGLPFIVDEAGLLTTDERTLLEQQAQEICERYGCAVYLIVLSDMRDYCESSSIRACAEEIRVGYQLGYGPNQDCVALVLSMAERDYDLISYGPHGLDEVFTGEARDWVTERFLPDLGQNDWYGGFSSYVTAAGDVLRKYENGEPLGAPNAASHIGLSILFSLLIGFIIALAISLYFRARMKSVRPGAEAGQYSIPQEAAITYRNDAFTHTTQTRTYSPRNSDKGGGGGGGFTSSSGTGHSSGKF